MGVWRYKRPEVKQKKKKDTEVQTLFVALKKTTKKAVLLCTRIVSTTK